MTQNIFNRVATRAKTEFYRRQYNAAAAAVLGTPAITPGDVEFILLSMVQKRDVLSYLVAVKSFVHYLTPRRIVVVCDPSIDAKDKFLLQSHIPHVELRAASEFADPRFPSGGCWERLLAITGYVANNYVVQLDADTVTMANLAVVKKSIEECRGFVLGEVPSQQIYTLRETSANVCLPPVTAEGKAPHIQISAESAMNSVGLNPDRKYVRGCAGFTGFPPNPAMLEELAQFSVAMSKHFGERWREWGTEQISSNYLVANAAPATVVLPYPDYGTPDVEDARTVFLHFIGSMRFISSRYKEITQNTVQILTPLS